MALEQAGLEWINKGLPVFVTNLEKGSNAMQGVGDAGEQSAFKLGGIAGIFAGISSTITELFIGSISKAKDAVIGFTKESLTMATEFQSAATRLQISGKGAAETAGVALNDLSEAALRVGGDTRLLGVSATGAAESLTELLKAGLPLNDVMGDFNAYMYEGAELGGALRGAIDLAAATELDMVEASSLAATSMTIFGLSADEVTSKLDYMVRGADASVADVSDLRDALEGAGPTLRGFGFTIEDSVDALSLLSNAGITGAEAGTALRSAWTQLTSDKAKVTSALEEQGIALTDLEGNYLSFKDILGQLEIATESMTQAEKAEFLQTVAGAYGKTALTALLDQGIEGYTEYEMALESAAGIEMQSAENAKTLASAQEALQGTMETLRIRVGSALIPVMNTLTGIFSQLVEKYSPQITAAFEAIGGVLSTLVNYFADVLGEGGYQFNDYLAQLPAVIQPVVETLGGLIILIKDFLAGAVGEDYPWAEMFPPGVVDIIQKIIDTGATIIEWKDNIVGAFNTIKSWVDENWTKIQAVIITAWTVISDVVMSVIDSIKPTIQSLIETMGEVDWKKIGEELKTFFAVVGVAIGAIAVAIVGVITGIINAVVNVAKTLVEHFDGVRETWDELVKNFKSGGLIATLKSFGKLLIKTFTLPLKIIWAAVSGFVKGIFDFFKNLKEKLVGHSIIPDMLSAILKVFTDTLDDIVAFVKKWVGIIVDWFNDLKDDVIELWDKLWSSVEDTVDKVVTAIKNTIDSWIDKIKSAWSSFVDNIKDKWETTWENIKKFVSDTVDTIKARITAFVDIVKNIWDDFIENLKQKISDGFESIKTGISEFIETIKMKWGEFVETIKTLWTNLWNNLVNAITEKVQTFIEKGKEIVEAIKSGISTAWENVKLFFSEALKKLGTTIVDAAQSLLEFGKEIVTKIRDGIAEWWAKEEGVPAFLKNALKNIGSALTDAWIYVMNVGGKIVSKISEGIGAVWYKITDFIKAAIEADDTGILSAIIGAAQSIIDAGGRIIEYIKTGISNVWNSFIDWLVDKIIGWFGDNPPSPSAVMYNPGRTSGGGGVFGGQAELPVLPQIAGFGGGTQSITSIEINASYANSQSEAGIYYDVSAALAGARI